MLNFDIFPTKNQNDNSKFYTIKTCKTKLRYKLVVPYFIHTAKAKLSHNKPKK